MNDFKKLMDEIDIINIQKDDVIVLKPSMNQLNKDYITLRSLDNFTKNLRDKLPNNEIVFIPCDYKIINKNGIIKLLINQLEKLKGEKNEK